MYDNRCRYLHIFCLVMSSKNEENWLRNYELLKAFVREWHHLPSKRRVENRGLLNWWKYNQKLIRADKISEERISLLKEIESLREK